MNYYRRYVGDYQRDTMHLSITEHGAYTLLLDAYYAKNGSIPPRATELYRLCGAESERDRAAVRKVADEFFPLNGDGNRHNSRADHELSLALPAIDRMREGGKKGAESRWGADRAGHSLPNGAGHEEANGGAYGVSIHPPTTTLKTNNNPSISKVVLNTTPLRSTCTANRVRIDSAKARAHLDQWATDGVTPAQLLQAITIAREQKPDPAVIPLAYLVPIVNDLRTGARQPIEPRGRDAIPIAIANLAAKANGTDHEPSEPQSAIEPDQIPEPVPERAPAADQAETDEQLDQQAQALGMLRQPFETDDELTIRLAARRALG